MSSWYSAEGAANPADKLSDPLYTESVTSFLNDEDLYKELMKANQLYTNFLISHPELIYQLLDLIAVLPSEQDTEERKYKYPMFASDLLIKNQRLITTFIKDQATRNKSLNKLFRFFEHKRILVSILPGYFQRVFQVLCKHQSHRYLLQYLQQNPELIVKMVSFTESLSVSKCLLNLIGVDSKQDYGIQDIKGWIQFKKSALRQCLEQLKRTMNELIIQNILEILKELIQKEEFYYHKRDLLPVIFETENIETYFRIASGKEMRYQALIFINSTLSYLGKIMSEQKERYYTQQNRVRSQLIEPNNLGKNQLQECMKNFPKMLASAKWKSTLENSEIIESIILSLKIPDISPCRMLIDLPFNIFEKVWSVVSSSNDLNILHTKFQKLMKTVVEHPFDQLISKAFLAQKNFNLIENIINYAMTKPDSFGIIVRVVKAWFDENNKPAMSKYFEANGEKVGQFVGSKILSEYLVNSSTELGGRQIEQQKQNKYTVKKFIIEVKEQYIPEKSEVFGSIDINFSFNDPPSISQDISQNTLDISTIPFCENDNLETLSLQRNISVTSQEEVAVSEPPKMVKQVSYQQKMKQMMESVTAQMQQKSKTPNKKNQRAGSRSASKKKINKWGNAENVPPSQNLSPQSIKSCVQVPVKIESVSSPVYLPKINLYRIPHHKEKPNKTLPNRERKISPRRDNKLQKIMRILREQVPIQV